VVELQKHGERSTYMPAFVVCSTAVKRKKKLHSVSKNM